LKRGVICVHVSLGIVVSFSFVSLNVPVAGKNQKLKNLMETEKPINSV
jgi:hypothetical protein